VAAGAATSIYGLLSKHVAMHHVDLVLSQIRTCLTSILPGSFCHSPRAVFVQPHYNKTHHHCWLENVSTARAVVKQNRRYSTRTTIRYLVLDASRLKEEHIFSTSVSLLPSALTKQNRWQRPSKNFQWV